MIAAGASVERQKTSAIAWRTSGEASSSSIKQRAFGGGAVVFGKV